MKNTNCMYGDYGKEECGESAECMWCPELKKDSEPTESCLLHEE